MATHGQKGDKDQIPFYQYYQAVHPHENQISKQDHQYYRLQDKRKIHFRKRQFWLSLGVAQLINWVLVERGRDRIVFRLLNS